MFSSLNFFMHIYNMWERSGSVVECLCVVSLSKNINPSLVLVQPRKTRPFITERLLMGRKESNQTNNQTIYNMSVTGVISPAGR